MHPGTSSVVPEPFQETNEKRRTFLFSRYVFRGASPQPLGGGCSNLRIIRKHNNIESALQNKYYVLTIFLTDFSTNTL